MKQLLKTIWTVGLVAAGLFAGVHFPINDTVLN